MSLKSSFRPLTAALALGMALTCVGSQAEQRPFGGRRPPNVVLIITDDQGYGDISLHGNPVLKTPNLDRLGTEGVRLTRFCVNPVCSPTRSSLMTGRYYYRTGVVDTYLGRSMMHPDEVTLPELLKQKGYRTGIFGKWHLGDNYPLRAIDQGFDESLVCSGGGITQPSDPPGNHYFDPILKKNGRAVKSKGYCTDVFTGGALEFIQTNRKRPFFCYLATNAPHDPLEVDDQYVAPFRQAGVDERTSKVYGMVKNIDDNVGRLLKRLSDLNLDRDTLVMFMTDNGPAGQRFNAGFRGAKGTVYEGGIRTACFMRWPGTLFPGTVDRQAAHIDLTPTLLELCGVALPHSVAVDGRSLAPLLKDPRAQWPDRTLFFQWHRGDRAIPFQSSAVRTDRYKLVNGKELFDLVQDPGERKDISGQQRDVVSRLRRQYLAWYRDVAATRGFEPPRIYLGSPHENPTTLTRQDWRGPDAGWTPASLGYWEVRVDRGGDYRITTRVTPASVARRIRLKVGAVEAASELPAQAEQVVFPTLRLAAGDARLEAEITGGARPVGVNYVDVERR